MANRIVQGDEFEFAPSTESEIVLVPLAADAAAETVTVETGAGAGAGADAGMDIDEESRPQFAAAKDVGMVARRETRKIRECCHGFWVGVSANSCSHSATPHDSAQGDLEQDVCGLCALHCLSSC